jgi:hypothetical protein
MFVEMIRSRITALPRSAISAKIPSEERLIPNGELNCEFVPSPFVKPEDMAVPANVVTFLVERMIFLMRWFDVSATKAYTPPEEIAIPLGKLNLAFVPIPFVLPADAPTPAMVVTLAVEIITRRTRWLFVSATTANVPSLEILTPES